MTTIRVHVDTEFTDFIACDLISIGCAADNGQDFYGENLDFNKKLSSTFVKENIYPLLKPEKFGTKRHDLSARLWEWIEDLPCDDVIITVDYPTDWALMKDLLDVQHPKIVAAQHVFTNISEWAKFSILTEGPFDGYRYEKLKERLNAIFYKGFMDYFESNETEIRHHSLADARANRQGYSRLIQDFGFPV